MQYSQLIYFQTILFLLCLRKIFLKTSSSWVDTYNHKSRNTLTRYKKHGPRGVAFPLLSPLPGFFIQTPGLDLNKFSPAILPQSKIFPLPSVAPKSSLAIPANAKFRLKRVDAQTNKSPQHTVITKINYCQLFPDPNISYSSGACRGIDNTYQAKLFAPMN